MRMIDHKPHPDPAPMRTTPKRSLFAAMTALLVACSPATQAGTIVLDPGHGGRDAGATEGQAKESEIMLSFAKVLEAELKEKGYAIILTRTSDEFVSSKGKEMYLKDVKPKVVLGLHLATSKDPSQRGIRIFRSPKAEDDKLLYEERELPDRLVKAFGEMEPKQTVTTQRLGKAYLDSPKALLIEFGYLSNPEDRKLILDPAYQKKLAGVLAETINELY
jgi:N-acetylmuramoyl-L-alanine amidase